MKAFKKWHLEVAIVSIEKTSHFAAYNSCEKVALDSPLPLVRFSVKYNFRRVENSPMFECVESEGLQYLFTNACRWHTQ